LQCIVLPQDNMINDRLKHVVSLLLTTVQQACN